MNARERSVQLIHSPSFLHSQVSQDFRRVWFLISKDGDGETRKTLGLEVKVEGWRAFFFVGDLSVQMESSILRFGNCTNWSVGLGFNAAPHNFTVRI